MILTVSTITTKMDLLILKFLMKIKDVQEAEKGQKWSTDTMKIRNRVVAKICELQVHFTTYLVASLADLLFPVSHESVKVFRIKQLSHEKDLKNPEKIYRTTLSKRWTSFYCVYDVYHSCIFE
jgi:hypothetical protein